MAEERLLVKNAKGRHVLLTPAEWAEVQLREAAAEEKSALVDEKDPGREEALRRALGQEEFSTGVSGDKTLVREGENLVAK